MAESFTELAILASQARKILTLWRHLGCTCLVDPWAEPWEDDAGALITYHVLDCPAVLAWTV